MWPFHDLSGYRRKGTPRFRTWFSGCITVAMLPKRSRWSLGLLLQSSFPKTRTRDELANTQGKRSLSCACFGQEYVSKRPLPGSGSIRRRSRCYWMTPRRGASGALVRVNFPVWAVRQPLARCELPRTHTLSTRAVNFPVHEHLHRSRCKCEFPRTSNAAIEAFRCELARTLMRSRLRENNPNRANFPVRQL
jgi:hypothetical protein